jgi:hypothetical protein
MGKNQRQMTKRRILRWLAALASKPHGFNLPPAIMQDDSDQELVDDPAPAKLKGKPKNKYYRQVLQKLRLKKQTHTSK